MLGRFGYVRGRAQGRGQAAVRAAADRGRRPRGRRLRAPDPDGRDRQRLPGRRRRRDHPGGRPRGRQARRDGLLLHVAVGQARVRRPVPPRHAPRARRRALPARPNRSRSPGRTSTAAPTASSTAPSATAPGTSSRRRSRCRCPSTCGAERSEPAAADRLDAGLEPRAAPSSSSSSATRRRTVRTLSPSARAICSSLAPPASWPSSSRWSPAPLVDRWPSSPGTGIAFSQRLSKSRVSAPTSECCRSTSRRSSRLPEPLGDQRRRAAHDRQPARHLREDPHVLARLGARRGSSPAPPPAPGPGRSPGTAGRCASGRYPVVDLAGPAAAATGPGAATAGRPWRPRTGCAPAGRCRRPRAARPSPPRPRGGGGQVVGAQRGQQAPDRLELVAVRLCTRRVSSLTSRASASCRRPGHHHVAAQLDDAGPTNRVTCSRSSPTGSPRAGRARPACCPSAAAEPVEALLAGAEPEHAERGESVRGR